MQKDTFKPYSFGEAKGNWLQPKVAPQGGPVCLPLVATHSEKTSGGEGEGSGVGGRMAGVKALATPTKGWAAAVLVKWIF